MNAVPRTRDDMKEDSFGGGIENRRLDLLAGITIEGDAIEDLMNRCFSKTKS